MLSVIIATRDSERPLVRTLAALVPGATSGLITEVLIADGGSRDDTPAVADIAGCKLLAGDEPLGRRLQAAADAARAPWLLFLQPGIVLDRLRDAAEVHDLTFAPDPATHSRCTLGGMFLRHADDIKPGTGLLTASSATAYHEANLVNLTIFLRFNPGRPARVGS